jgi:transposase-like protein
MSKHNVVELAGREKVRDELTELIREGACKLIAQGLELEVSELLSALSERRDEAGRAAVVRNGYQPDRDIQTGIGPVSVKVPKIRSRDGKPVSFRSALVPPYVRKTASLEAALPWLYLKGISTGEMRPALEVLLGSRAKGLSASTVSRLKQTWRDEYATWRHRRLDKDRWVYIWVDGIYSGLRAERQRLCALVIVATERWLFRVWVESPISHSINATEINFRRSNVFVTYYSNRKGTTIFIKNDATNHVF